MTGDTRLLRKRQEVNYKPPVYRSANNNVNASGDTEVSIPPNRRDKVVTEDGRVFFPCPYCSRAFTDKVNRTIHVKICPAKSYILTVANENAVANISTESGGKNDTEKQDEESTGTLKRTRSFTEEEQKAFMQAVQLAKVSDTKQDPSRRVYKMRARLKTQKASETQQELSSDNSTSQTEQTDTVKSQQKPNAPSKKTVTKKILNSHNELLEKGVGKKPKAMKSEKCDPFDITADTVKLDNDPKLYLDKSVLVENNATLNNDAKSNTAKKSTLKISKPKSVPRVLVEKTSELNGDIKSNSVKKSTPKIAKSKSTPSVRVKNNPVLDDNTKSNPGKKSTPKTIKPKTTPSVAVQHNNTLNNDPRSNPAKKSTPKVAKSESTLNLVVQCNEALNDDNTKSNPAKKSTMKIAKPNKSTPINKKVTFKDEAPKSIVITPSLDITFLEQKITDLVNLISTDKKTNSSKISVKKDEMNGSLIITTEPATVKKKSATKRPSQSNIGPAKKQKKNDDSLQLSLAGHSSQAKPNTVESDENNKPPEITSHSAEQNPLNESLQAKSASNKKKSKLSVVNSSIPDISQEITESAENRNNEPLKANQANSSDQEKPKAVNKKNKNSKKVVKPKSNETDASRSSNELQGSKQNNSLVNKNVAANKSKKQIKKVTKSSGTSAKKAKVLPKNKNKGKTLVLPKNKSPTRTALSNDESSLKVIIENIIHSLDGNEDLQNINDKSIAEDIIEENINKNVKCNDKNSNLDDTVENKKKTQKAKQKRSRISFSKVDGKITKPKVNRVKALKLKKQVDKVVKANVKRLQPTKSDPNIITNPINTTSEVNPIGIPSIISKQDSSKGLFSQEQTKQASNKQLVQKPRTKQASITQYTINCSENKLKSNGIQQNSKLAPVHNNNNNNKQSMIASLLDESNSLKIQNMNSKDCLNLKLHESRDEKALIDPHRYSDTKIHNLQFESHKSIEVKSPQIREGYKLNHSSISNKVGTLDPNIVKNYDLKTNEKVMNLGQNDPKTETVQMRTSHLMHKPLTEDELLSLLALSNDVQVDCIIQTSVKHESKPIIRSKSFNAFQLETLRVKANSRMNSPKDIKQWASTDSVNTMVSSNNKNDDKSLFHELLVNNIPKDDMHPKKLEKYLKEFASGFKKPPPAETVIKKVQYTQQNSNSPLKLTNIPSIDISTLKRGQCSNEKSLLGSPKSANRSLAKSQAVEAQKSNTTIETSVLNVSQEDLEREFNEGDDKFEENEDACESDEMDSLLLEEEDDKSQIEPELPSVSSIPNSTNSTTCRYCFEQFERHVDMVRHRRLVHQLPKILVSREKLEECMITNDYTQCPICKKVMRPRQRPSQSKWDYIKHLKTHSEDRNYACSKCDKTFKRSDSLREHERKHV